jgi:hypothetical protein
MPVSAEARQEQGRVSEYVGGITVWVIHGTPTWTVRNTRKMVEKLGPSPPHSEMQSCVAVRVGDVAVHMVAVLRVGE